MSLENIKDVINHYERHVSPGSYGEASVRAAREEVEAIEKACASMRNAEVFIPAGLGNIRDLDVLFNIAKESK